MPPVGITYGRPNSLGLRAIKENGVKTGRYMKDGIEFARSKDFFARTYRSAGGQVLSKTRTFNALGALAVFISGILLFEGGC